MPRAVRSFVPRGGASRHLPPPAPHRPALTTRGINRMQLRVELMQRRGSPELHAERWADVLHQRDLDSDDRRMCVECAHLRHDWSCTKRGIVVVDLLQRCEKFGWQTP